MISGGAECEYRNWARDLGYPLLPDPITDTVRRAIGMKTNSPYGAGFAGFKGPPGVASTRDGVGEVEIGYCVAPDV